MWLRGSGVGMEFCQGGLEQRCAHSALWGIWRRAPHEKLRLRCLTANIHAHYIPSKVDLRITLMSCIVKNYYNVIKKIKIKKIKLEVSKIRSTTIIS